MTECYHVPFRQNKMVGEKRARQKGPKVSSGGLGLGGCLVESVASFCATFALLTLYLLPNQSSRIHSGTRDWGTHFSWYMLNLHS